MLFLSVHPFRLAQLYELRVQWKRALPEYEWAMNDVDYLPGVANATYKVGIATLFGFGARMVDKIRAYLLLLKADRLGVPEAKSMLAYCHLHQYSLSINSLLLGAFDPVRHL